MLPFFLFLCLSSLCIQTLNGAERKQAWPETEEHKKAARAVKHAKDLIEKSPLNKGNSYCEISSDLLINIFNTLAHHNLRTYDAIGIVVEAIKARKNQINEWETDILLKAILKQSPATVAVLLELGLFSAKLKDAYKLSKKIYLELQQKQSMGEIEASDRWLATSETVFKVIQSKLTKK